MNSNRLGGFLDRAFDTPFGWRTHDCLIWPANWVALVSGRDPAAPWRNAYHDARSALRLVSDAGGIEALVRTAMAREGFEMTDTPTVGDVGLVHIISGRGVAELAGGICTAPGHWCNLTANGLLEGRARHALAFRIEAA
ncbi:hypothetical protein AEAC466_17400 [Asticcacaulis sp. AC466]|nr:hypothetical protein AEAC466_17400 [Asticcacaulis sp. AC466]